MLALDVVPDPLDHLELGTEDLDAECCPDPGREHVGAVLDGHGPGVHRTQHPKLLVHLGDELILGHSLAPLRLRLEVYDGLDHGDRRPVGGRVGPAGLAPDRLHLGEGHDQAVLQLKQATLLGQ